MRHLPALRCLPVFGVILAAALCVVSRSTQAQHLAELPTDERALGNAFVDSWLVLRSEIDGLSATSAHPALLEQWIAVLPRSVLVDMLRLVTEPRAMMVIAARLGQLGTQADLDELRRLQGQMAWPGLADKLIEIRVRSSDKKLIEQLRGDLASEAPVVRLKAAEHLGCAGDRAGLEELRRALGSDSEALLSTAARALARCGTGDDLDRLRRFAQKRPRDPVAMASVGEFLARRSFPWHYDEITRRDAAFVHDSAPGGTLDTWYASLGRVIEQGTTSSASVPAALSALGKRGPLFEDDAEVLLRRMTSLSETWSAIEACLVATPKTPMWPERFGAAVADLTPVAPNLETPADRARRITAAVSILATLSERLGYDDGSRALPAVALSPGLERALDRNFATAHRLVPGQTMWLDLGKPTVVRALFVSSACGVVEGSSVMGLRIVLQGSQGTLTKVVELDPSNRFFQRVQLGGSPATRLGIEVMEASGQGPACLSELRLR